MGELGGEPEGGGMVGREDLFVGLVDDLWVEIKGGTERYRLY